MLLNTSTEKTLFSSGVFWRMVKRAISQVRVLCKRAGSALETHWGNCHAIATDVPKPQVKN
ncbi:hypothetical protein [Cylindrospermopsis raciborskii]|uniref:hypothetical protein n=1 Tax=Cylindrospermopsis raciborskii TaxID=77022 RepID=UPI00128F4D01|nr:hypothetical protein [Cylindrospermopsis raciborskii]